MPDRSSTAQAEQGGIPVTSYGASEAERLAQILEVVPGGIVQVASTGAILRANAQAQRFLGLSYDAITKRFVTDFAGETFHEDGSPCPPTDYPVVQCLTTGEPSGPGTIGVRQPSGEVRWAIFTAVPFPDPNGGGLGAVVTFVDITERRHTELRVRAHDRLLDSVRMVHLRDDPGATVAVFHEPLSIFLELTSSTLGFIASVGGERRPPEEMRLHARIDTTSPNAGSSSPPVPVDELSARAITSGERAVAQSPGAIGGPFFDHAPNVAAVLPLRAAGRVVGVVGLADAPTGYSDGLLADLDPLLAACADLIAAFDERRARARLEAQLAQAERLASVGTLAAGMAHEINNPLAYVLLNLTAFERHAQALEQHLAQMPVDKSSPSMEGALKDLRRLRDSARDALEGAERVHRIVRDLTTFSRVTDERKLLVDVNAAVEVALKMADHEIKYRARLVRELGTIDPVLGNDGRLSQVFLNLLINAARAIEEGHPELNEIRVRSWMEGQEVLVEVADTGEGVPPEHLDHLFEPFFSTRAPGAGAGLGLTICHNVVRAHGGRVDVTSEVGEGTRFVVRLPRADRTVRRAPTPIGTPAMRPREGRARILIVDDEPMVLRVLAQLLRRTYDVDCAEGFTTATALLSRNEHIDVVLCDMMMLDGTGVDVYAWVSENRPALAKRMVFMTGGTFTPKARAFLSTVAAPHMVKPFSLRELDEVVSSILE